MIPFRYGGFWDVPRYIHLNYGGRSLLLLCPFDDEIDEHPDHYTVCEVPADVESGSELTWGLKADGDGRADFVLGTILVRDVRFDSTMREMLDSSVLDGLVSTKTS